MSIITYDQKITFIERAKKGKAEKGFILSILGLIPRDNKDCQDLEKLGFKSLSEFIQTPKGLVLDAETFVKLAFAYWVYRHHACRVIKYLVTQEGWTELLEYIPSDYVDESGGVLIDKGGDRKSKDYKPSQTATKGGTSKAYILLRLKKEGATKAKDLYDQVKSGKLSAAKAAVIMGWKQPTATIRKDVNSTLTVLNKLFDKEELKQIEKGLQSLIKQ